MLPLLSRSPHSKKAPGSPHICLGSLQTACYHSPKTYIWGISELTVDVGAEDGWRIFKGADLRSECNNHHLILVHKSVYNQTWCSTFNLKMRCSGILVGKKIFFCDLTIISELHIKSSFTTMITALLLSRGTHSQLRHQIQSIHTSFSQVWKPEKWCCLAWL